MTEWSLSTSLCTSVRIELAFFVSKEESSSLVFSFEAIRV